MQRTRETALLQAAATSLGFGSLLKAWRAEVLLSRYVGHQRWSLCEDLYQKDLLRLQLQDCCSSKGAVSPLKAAKQLQEHGVDATNMCVRMVQV